MLIHASLGLENSEYLQKLALQYEPSAMKFILDRCQLGILVQYPDWEFQIKDVSDVALLSYKKLSEAADSRGTTCVYTECSSFQEMSSHSKQKSEYAKHGKINQYLMLNYPALIAFANKLPSNEVFEEKPLSAYKGIYANVMARLCLRKVKDILGGLDGKHYYYEASGFPCIDLGSSLTVSGDDASAEYAIKFWYDWANQAVILNMLDNATRQLLEEILSHTGDLYYATFVDRDDPPKYLSSIMMELSVRISHNSDIPNLHLPFRNVCPT